MHIRKAIITAAGFGSRFLPWTKTFPKEMLPILDKPIAHWLAEECAAAGIEEIIIVALPSEVKKFEDYFYGGATSIRVLMNRQHKLERWAKVEQVFTLPRVTVVAQDESLPYGNGSPILSTKDLVSREDAFAVLWGDDLVLSQVSALRQLVDFFHARPCDALLAVQEVAETEVERYGIIKPREGTIDEFEHLVEKPRAADAPSRLASYGRYILTPKIFEYLSGERTGKDGELWLPDAIDALAQAGTVRFIKVEGEWMTTGDPERYIEAHVKFALADPGIGARLKEKLEGIVKHL